MASEGHQKDGDGLRSPYLEVEVRLCEVLVQGRGQVLHGGDYDAAGREQSVGRLNRLTMAPESLASTAYGLCAHFLSTTCSHVRCDYEEEGQMAQAPKKISLGETPHCGF